MRRRSLLLAIGVALAVGPAAHAETTTVETLAGRVARDPDVSDEKIREAIGRGVEYLVSSQNPDGSWGGPAPNLNVDIYAPNKGAHDAYQAATSALALSALLEVGAGRSGVDEAIRKGTDWLVANHDAKRCTPDVIYNVWAHAYGLEAFARLLARETDEARRAEIRAAARDAVRLLERFEYVDGGWGYYDFSVGSKTPSHGHANSFTTATALVGLSMAEAQGIDVPERLVRRGKALIQASRLPGGAYSYSFNLRHRAPWGVNKVRGSLARTPACQAALIAAGVDVPQPRVVAALDRLEELGHYLLIARKYPRPHESWFQNSGYFCFYGYYYASDLLSHLPPRKRAFHRRRIAARLVPLQEKDGAWWDYQLYRYHKPYGTGYVLMSLGRCLAAAEATSKNAAEAAR